MTDEAPPYGQGDRDYEAIEAAVMETARGRWFMAEFARRNRSADTEMLLAALARLEEAVAAGQRAQSENLRAEMEELARSLAAMLPAMPPLVAEDEIEADLVPAPAGVFGESAPDPGPVEVPLAAIDLPAIERSAADDGVGSAEAAPEFEELVATAPSIEPGAEPEAAAEQTWEDAVAATATPRPSPVASWPVPASPPGFTAYAAPRDAEPAPRRPLNLEALAAIDALSTREKLRRFS